MSVLGIFMQSKQRTHKYIFAMYYIKYISYRVSFTQVLLSFGLFLCVVELQHYLFMYLASQKTQVRPCLNLQLAAIGIKIKESVNKVFYRRATIATDGTGGTGGTGSTTGALPCPGTPPARPRLYHYTWFFCQNRTFNENGVNWVFSFVTNQYFY